MSVSQMTAVFRIEDVSGLPLDTENVAGHGLTDEVLIAVTKRCPGLLKLDLSGSEDLTDESVRWLSTVKALQEIDLSLCNRVTDHSVTSLSTLPRLRSLTLNWCYSITDRGLEALSACKSLERLSLWSCEEVTDKGVMAIAKLPSLRSLDLPEFANVTDAAMLYLSANATGIEHLRIAVLDDVTDQGVFALANLRNLTSISIRGCRNVTPEAIEFLTQALPAAQMEFEAFPMG